MKYILIAVALCLPLTTACTLQEPDQKATTLSTTEQFAMSRFMAVGDNIISGYQSGALTKKYQDYSFVAQIAKVSGTPNFQQPILGYPGLGSESYAGYGVLELINLDNPQTPFTLIPDPVVYPAAFSDYPDFRPALPFYTDSIMFYPLPYSNLAVPGIFVEDVLTGTTRLNSKSKSGLLDVILRNPLPEPYGYKSAYEQAKLFAPSIVACWVGMYDVMGYAQVGLPGQRMTAPTSIENFGTHYQALMDSLLTITSAVVVANIPDITDFPYFHVVPGVVVDSMTNTPYKDNDGNTIDLIGVNSATDLVLLPAKSAIRQGYGKPLGIQNGNGLPIPEEYVLDADEITIIRDAISGYNSAIASICSGRIPVVDMYSFYKMLNGGIGVGGLIFSSAYLVGGFYSLDGIHPSNAGNAVIANLWIDRINQAYGVSIPPVDVLKVMQDTQPDRY